MLFVLVEWGCIAYGMFGQSSKMLYHFFIYGSPVYLVMNIFTEGSALFETNMYIVLMSVFHVLKYVCIVQSQVLDDRNGTAITAILLEILYLSYSGYLLY
jgi:hypothetical protein